MPDISLRCVAKPDGQPHLNVIFVHGLGGDHVTTWCDKGGENGGYFWPRGIAEERNASPFTRLVSGGQGGN
jgi:hypothetical protein